MIGNVDGIFSTYTKHDISHIDEMLNMLEWLVPPSTKEHMTPVDWLMTVLSIYLHDLGMVVTSEEYDKRMDNPVFKQFLEGLDNDSDGRDYIARAESMDSEEKNRFFYQEFIRIKHASRIREWITGRHSSQWNASVKSITDEIKKIIDNLPTRFRENLATVCESHHKDDLDNTERYPLCQHYGSNPKELANVQYSAILLRTTDLLHITKDRTPSVMYKIIRLSDPKSVEAWKTQRGTFSVSMKSREFNSDDTDSHVIMVSADFTEEKPYFALTEYLAYADSQIIQSKNWVDISQTKDDGKYYSFPWKNVKDDVKVEGNEPETMSFELDKGKLLDLLVGHTIYNDPTVAVRELLQNAIDAVRFQHHLHKMKDNGNSQMGRVLVKWDPDGRELIIEDDGIGMDLHVIRSNLMSVGSSFYDTQIFHDDYPDFTPISRFGIGILTCFMISDDIEIITFKNGIGYRIRMSSVHARYLLKKLDAGNPILNGLEPHGTQVRLRLRSSVDLKDNNILDIVRYWIVLPTCKVLYSEKGHKSESIGFENISEALIFFHFSDSTEKMNENYEIMEFSESHKNETYEIAFAVRKSLTPERNFMSSSNAEIPATCIEGIRADDFLPGFDDQIIALISVKGNKRFRTTVSRMGLEKDDEYIKVAEICAKLLFKHIENEVKRISEQDGRPLSQASTAGLWLLERLNQNIISDSKIGNYINNRSSDLPYIVIENIIFEGNEQDEIKASRELITPEQLKQLNKFWTIESRLIDYLGIISRDLGRELSLNEFLISLAPEFQDIRINPVVPDLNQFESIITSSHSVGKVEFSREHQQTLIEWCPQDKHNTQGINYFELIRNNISDKEYKDFIKALKSKSKSERLVSTSSFNMVIARIEGDMSNIWGINTRALFIVKSDTIAQEILTSINKAILKLSKDVKFDELFEVIQGYQQFNEACKTFSRVNIDRSSIFPRRIRDNSDNWYNIISKVNIIFENLSIDYRIPENYTNFLSNCRENGEVFDASSYWLDWTDYDS